MQGLSRSNLFNAKKFYQFYNNLQIVQQPVGLIHQQTADKLQALNNKQKKNRQKLVQQLVALIPWGHNILIFTKAKELKEALFYIQKTKENNWSRDMLALQIKKIDDV